METSLELLMNLLESGEGRKLQSTTLNLQAPCVLYLGQAFRYTPENAFYIFNQQIYFIV